MDILNESTNLALTLRLASIAEEADLASAITVSAEALSGIGRWKVRGAEWAEGTDSRGGGVAPGADDLTGAWEG